MPFDVVHPQFALFAEEVSISRLQTTSAGKSSPKIRRKLQGACIRIISKGKSACVFERTFF